MGLCCHVMSRQSGYTQDTIDLLEQDKWFSGLPAHIKQVLLESSRPLRYGANQNIFVRGGPCGGMYCILKGQVRIQSNTLGGTSGVLQTLEPSQWFGELALFGDHARSHDAHCARSTTLLHVPAAALENIGADYPEIYRHLGELLAHKMRCLFAGLEAFALLPAKAWIARRLLMIAVHHWTKDEVLNSIPMRQEEFAQMLALTRQTVSKLLQDFEAEGVIQIGYGYIRILNWDRLREMAEMAPPSD